MLATKPAAAAPMADAARRGRAAPRGSGSCRAVAVSRRVIAAPRSCASWIQPERGLRRLVDLERLHRDGAGRAALGAQAAADAARLVLHDRAQLDASAPSASRTASRSGVPLQAARAGTSARHAFGTDLDAAAAEDAALGVEDRLDVAPQAARRFEARLLLAVAFLDLAEARCGARPAARAPPGAGSGRSGRRARSSCDRPEARRARGARRRRRATRGSPAPRACRRPPPRSRCAARTPGRRRSTRPASSSPACAASTATSPRGVIWISASAGQAARCRAAGRRRG